MTLSQANLIVQSSARCTEATLKAFGVEGIPTQGSGCLEFLTNAGFILTRVQVNGVKLFNTEHSLCTMSKLNNIFKGSLIWKGYNYIVLTPGHAMAIVDGILIDTEHKGWDGRRIEYIWKVEK